MIIVNLVANLGPKIPYRELCINETKSVYEIKIKIKFINQFI